MRDSQRSKAYAAEAAAFTNPPPDLTIDEAQALVHKWASSRVLQRHYPRAAVPVRVTYGKGRSMYERQLYRWDEIRLAVRGRHKRTLLHEYAHHLCPNTAGHGWQWCECFLYLLRVHMGRGAEEALKEQFRIHKVKYRKPRKRNMTEEQRQAARERMLALHAAKREARIAA